MAKRLNSKSPRVPRACRPRTSNPSSQGVIPPHRGVTTSHTNSGRNAQASRPFLFLPASFPNIRSRFFPICRGALQRVPARVCERAPPSFLCHRPCRGAIYRAQRESPSTQGGSPRLQSGERCLSRRREKAIANTKGFSHGASLAFKRGEVLHVSSRPKWAGFFLRSVFMSAGPRSASFASRMVLRDGGTVAKLQPHLRQWNSTAHR